MMGCRCDCKNQWVFALSALLTASGNFKVCFNQYLRTGHSHADVDAMFGTWARHLALQPTLETPEHVMRCLQSEFGKDTQFEKLDYVRDWRAFLNACRVEFSGMGGSELTAHSFTWFTRDC